MSRAEREAAQVAERLGLDYRAKVDDGLRGRIEHVPELTRRGKIRHVFEGALDDRPLMLFQSSYMVYTGQGAVEVAHTVYVCAAPEWPLLHITPRGLLGRLAARLGRRPDLALESEQFNRRLKVRTVDDDFAIALLSPEMQAFLVSKPSVRWHTLPGRLCMVYRGPLKPPRIEGSLQRLRRFWTLVPPELEAWS